MVFTHVVCFAKDVSVIRISSESHCLQITCLLLNLIFVPASASTHINSEMRYFHKTPFCR